MDKSSKPPSSSQHLATSPSWLTVLAVLTFIHTSAFITVIVLQFTDLMTIDEEGNNLRQMILHLAAEVNSGSNDRENITPRDMDEELSSQEKSVHPNHAGDHKIKRATSIFLDILMAQERVIQDHCNQRNKTCVKGAKGDMGQSGDQGEKGEQGLRGENGLKGLYGSLGLPGPTGDFGEKGQKGDTGLIGPIGPPGVKGIRGEDGLKGLKGSQGSKGSKGEHGDKGLLGEKGAVGKMGDPGLQGVKGDTGDIGSTGHKGATGEQGRKGLDVKPIIGDCDCLQKPAFDAPSASNYVVSPLSQSAEFPCNATGFPTPSVTITKTASSGKHSVQNVPGYIFIQSEADYGTYTCTAENVFGKALKQVTVMKTGENPAILRIPFDNVYQIGANVTYVCDAFGVPTPEVRFLKDGQEVNSTSRLSMTKATRLNRTSVTLLFQNLDASDIGTYVCTANNAFGEITSQPFHLNATTNIHG